MRLVLMKNEKLDNFLLPSSVIGNYWITDFDTDNKKRNLFNVEAIDGKWILKSNFEVKVFFGGKEIETIELRLYNFYIIKTNNNESIVLYCEPIYDKSYLKLQLSFGEYVIGKSANCDITFDYDAIKENHLVFIYKDDKYSVVDKVNSNLIYINGKRVSSSNLKYGDVLFFCGLKIIFMKDYILLNQIGSLIKYNNRFNVVNSDYGELIVSDYDEESNLKPLYTKEDYFYKSPRFKTIIEKESMQIDAPPSKENQKEMPIIYTIGPMITMSMTSVVFALSAVNNMVSNNGSIWTVLPTVVMSMAMLCSVALWPSLTKKYEKKQKIKREQERQDKYTNYIEGKRNKINLMMKLQSQILRDNFIPLSDCASIISNKKTILWNREISDEDFLSLRVGIGIQQLELDVNYREEDFMMEDDNLKVLAESLVNETRNLMNVPISYSFKDKFVSGIVGNMNLIREFLSGLLLQIATFYSYDEVKVVVITNERNSYKYDYLKFLPHLFSNDKKIRFFASDVNAKKELSLYLERIFNSRKFTDDGKINKNDYKSFKPYYVIITDDYDSIRDLEIIKDVLKQDLNVGFSLIILNEKLAELPNECESFINVSEKSSGIFESEVTSTKQQEFSADYPKDLSIEDLFRKLANIPLEVLESDSNLPETLGFLQMYNIGMVEQLNINNKYRKSNPVYTLQAPIGVDKSGELLYLDLHEKAHGPHGLIAGMTGSGKSEFIITYILSMAVNYSPDEVAFVLIDYKGGGLAGAFENKETGVKLPHLAGTITNLDVADMDRSLASIQSELRRRQAAFNIARDKYGESTIDIYKYQTLFKEGKVDEPIPHLIIISDEFAELKSQQPDFMDQLISTARIGRSLGVHLILATQKPSGVVNDQIWSNSKFRVCLKVQEKNDSTEMIKTPDAAAIKNVGRFYLQVGYNELFTMGQSAWCGGKYYPTEKIRKKVDTSINFINEIGSVIKSADKDKQSITDNGEEITNILKYIIDVCNNNSVRKLWLDKIPDVIFTDDLKQKYSISTNYFELNPIVGEYDNPSNQSQGILTVPISNCSNSVIYGVSGSGKELMLSTIIYSLITNHTPEEVNIYILDCGTELLRIFNGAPHVGDILSIGDNEKIDKLFQMLEQEIEFRKEKFSNYAGDYNIFIKNSTEKLPLILVILNNYDNFIEGYEGYFERLNGLIREGSKYGIVTILSAAGPNSMRIRIRQNFKQEYALHLTDFNDYYNIFGRFEKKSLPDIKGRGFVKLDDVYEFQVSYPYEESNLSSEIRNLCESLKIKYPNKAKKVPILPSIVDYKYLKSSITNLKNVPIGINKNNLNVEKFDFTKKGISLITGQGIDLMIKFLNEFIKIISNMQNTSLIVIDAEEIITDFNTINTNFDSKIEQIYNLIVKNDLQNQCLCVIVGLDSLIGKISTDTKNKLIEIFNIDRENSQISIVFVEAYTKLKKLEFESWYKNNVINNSGIWIGNGIINQYTILINKITSDHRNELSENFGYVIRNGKTTLIKLLENNEIIEVIE